MNQNESMWKNTGGLWSGRSCHAWEPATDIYRTGDGWVVKLDLAGVDPDELTVQIHDQSILITGTRRDRTLREGVTHYQMEITYSRFERTINLPCDLAHARLVTDYQHGLLILTFLTGE